jgi:large-conductance mechanosensitive channel
MTPDDIAIIKVVAAAGTAFAAILTAFYVVIMRPLIKLLRERIVFEIKAELTTMQSELKADINGLRTEMKLEFAAVRAELGATEKRLNDRIDTYVMRPLKSDG